MKEQIYFYERAENHKAKEWMLKSFNQVNIQMQGWINGSWNGGLYKNKGVGVRFADFISFILNIP